MNLNSWFEDTIVGVSQANLAAVYVPMATELALFFQLPATIYVEEKYRKLKDLL